MASYTPIQYREQARVTAIIAAANMNRTCPICHQPQGTWADGAKRITCGKPECYRKWLAIRPKEHNSGT